MSRRRNWRLTSTDAPADYKKASRVQKQKRAQKKRDEIALIEGQKLFGIFIRTHGASLPKDATCWLDIRFSTYQGRHTTSFGARKWVDGPPYPGFHLWTAYKIGEFGSEFPGKRTLADTVTDLEEQFGQHEWDFTPCYHSIPTPHEFRFSWVRKRRAVMAMAKARECTKPPKKLTKSQKLWRDLARMDMASALVIHFING